MVSNRDFKDLFSALSAADVKFLVVGAHAVMLYRFRATRRISTSGWNRRRENAGRVHAALVAFGAPLSDLSVEDLAVPGTIFQMGVEPNRIDVVTSIDGVEFTERLGSDDPLDVRRRSDSNLGDFGSPDEQDDWSTATKIASTSQSSRPNCAASDSSRNRFQPAVCLRRSAHLPVDSR